MDVQGIDNELFNMQVINLSTCYAAIQEVLSNGLCVISLDASEDPDQQDIMVERARTAASGLEKK